MEDGGTGMRIATASVRTGFAMTEAERICVSFRDQSADWSWESVIPLRKSKGVRITTPMTHILFYVLSFLAGRRRRRERRALPSKGSRG